MEMLAGVKSQMTGWFSGGIGALGRGAPQGSEGGLQPALDETLVAQNVEAPGEQTKDDDASR